MNKVLLTAIVGSLSAQVLKIIINYIYYKKIDFRIIFSTGGMPSSHAASVMALSTAVGIEEGFNSNIFAICLFFSFIVMYDAAGIRRAAGKQAEILNKILDDLYAGRKADEKLKELLGHTPVEVFIGAIWGIIIALIMYAL
ncbi:MAG: divergent PAP2 family protein [candidate division WOR-3 bacterium]|nr:divergent PAP2 family protein [candidate division WOR-3 bacterium]MCX7947573.1 divergent PAP2 family protein [candidate division WOR-3 bacterium]MDW8150458.1 divergent PAP2 family protein [candidate division WOR-3 bacterium]